MLADIADVISSVLVPMILLLGIFFIIYLKGFFIVRPKKCFKLTFAEGGKSLREISVSLAGTLGVGNIVGIGVAISIGGAGAVFWIWLSAIIAMVLKYCEIILALRYRKKGEKEYIGGPMYYMRDGIGGKIGKTIAVAFAVLGCVSSFTLGNIVQTGSLASIGETVGVPKIAVGIIVGIATAAVVFFGFKGVSKISEIIVPIMSVAYVVVSVRAIIMCRANLPAVFSDIFTEAFRFESAAGGILGFFISPAVRAGMQKGVVAHEAGCGTAPVAHAQAEPKVNATQGLLGMLEVIISTLVMCTLTALVILSSGVPIGEGEGTVFGAKLVENALRVTCGDAAKYILNFIIAVFVFSTIICWSYYGKMYLSYFCKSKIAPNVFLFIYCGVTVIGALMDEGDIWRITDISVALMTIINLAVVFCLRKIIKRETDETFFGRLF